MNKQDFIVVSVESQKGGVGKTTVAMNVARLLLESKKYEVLFLDLDIAGTEAELAVRSPLWKSRVNLVEFSYEEETREGKKTKTTRNLVQLFEHYMVGGDVPAALWREASEASTEEKLVETGRVTLCHGKINVTSSFLPVHGKGKGPCSAPSGYGPAVLFDSAHSQWFVDMIRSLIANALASHPKNRLAVVIDTSPGFSGLGPSVEEWLTDLGPERAKFLVVNALDHQDIVACVRAIIRLEDIYRSKWTGAKLFRDLHDAKSSDMPELADEAERFFARMASSDSDAPLSDQSDDVEAAVADELGFFRLAKHEKAEAYLSNGEGWWGILYNRIPLQIATGEYEYRWKELAQECAVYGARAEEVAKRCEELFRKHRVPYRDAFAFQFIADQLNPTSSTKGHESRHTRRIPASLGRDFDPHSILKPSVTPSSIQAGAHQILNALGHAETVFRRIVEPVWSPVERTREQFQVEWGRFAPTWLFTCVLRNTSGTQSTLKRLMTMHIDERIGRASEFMDGPANAYVNQVTEWASHLSPELVGHDDAFGSCLPVYVLSNMLAAVAIKQATRKSLDLTEKELRAQVFRSQRLVLMASLVHGLQPIDNVASLTEAYWVNLISAPQLVRRGENALSQQCRNLLQGQRLFATQSTNEYMCFCRSQFPLVSGRSDAEVLAAAARVIAETPKQGAMAALVDRVLEETLIARLLSPDTALSYFAAVLHGDVGERPDPLQLLMQMDVMTEFRDALAPILSAANWNLT